MPACSNPWSQPVRSIAQACPASSRPTRRRGAALHAPLGVERASYYSTAPLRETLRELVDFERINAQRRTRLTVGAVNARSGEMRYFDSRDERARASTT